MAPLAVIARLNQVPACAQKFQLRPSDFEEEEEESAEECLQRPRTSRRRHLLLEQFERKRWGRCHYGTFIN